MIRRFDDVHDGQAEAAYDPPAFLTGEARQRFTAVAEQLRTAGRLAATDYGSLVRYATLWAAWYAAAKQVSETEGGIAYTQLIDRGGNPARAAPGPAMAQMLAAGTQLLALEDRLGLNPKARARMPDSGAVETDPLAEYFPAVGRG